MKKLIYFVFTMLLIITLTTGCTENSTKPTSTGEPIVLKDGTYSATGQADQMGWVPEMSITITNGKVTNVIYDEMTAMRKTENIEYQKNWKSQNKIDLLTVYGTLQNTLMKNQDISKLDAIAGATKTVENFKALAEEAIKSATVDNQLKDGNFSATGIKDEKSWTPSIEMTIKDGKISAVKYDEVSSKVYKYKSHDKAYIAKFKEQSKLDLLEVYGSLQKSLIEKQNPSKVDSIAGASQTYDKFVKLTSQVLEKAR